MTVGILYLKSNNTIHLFESDVVEIKTSMLVCNNILFEGYNENEVGVIVVDSLSFKYDEEKQKNYLEDAQGNKFTYGDALPEGLTDISEQFRKPTIEELTNKTIILSEENATLKQELANTNAMLLEFMENNLV